MEVEFIADAYKKLNKKAAHSLREDFCGTQLICAEWVKSGDKRTATGVDIDPKVLAWGKKHNIEPLGDAAGRITQLAQDVRAPSKGKFDAICAFNFSYWIFKTRDEMRGYFEKVKKSLAPGGIFCLDAYGGWEAVEPMYERRNIKGKFTYVWDQDIFDPITHRVVNYIHFEFKDGSKMNKAFTYDWRFWSLPELTRAADGGRLLERRHLLGPERRRRRRGLSTEQAGRQSTGLARLLGGIAMTRPRFHLAFAVADLAAAERFYVESSGCQSGPEGRPLDRLRLLRPPDHRPPGDRTDGAAADQSRGKPSRACAPLRRDPGFSRVGGSGGQAPRGRRAIFDRAAHPLRGRGRRTGHAVFQDPSGNAIEMKAFRDQGQVFKA